MLTFENLSPAAHRDHTFLRPNTLPRHRPKVQWRPIDCVQLYVSASRVQGRGGW